MSENTVKPTETAAKSEQPEIKRVSVALPADQYDRLIDGERFDLRMEKPEYLRHVFNVYEKASTDR